MHKTLSLGLYSKAETEDCKRNFFFICCQKWGLYTSHYNIITLLCSFIQHKIFLLGLITLSLQKLRNYWMTPVWEDPNLIVKVTPSVLFGPVVWQLSKGSFLNISRSHYKSQVCVALWREKARALSRVIYLFPFPLRISPGHPPMILFFVTFNCTIIDSAKP